MLPSFSSQAGKHEKAYTIADAGIVPGRHKFDLFSVTRAFYKQMIRKNRIPLNLSDPEPNEESLAAIRETEGLIAKGEPGHSSAAEMFRAMEL